MKKIILPALVLMGVFVSCKKDTLVLDKTVVPENTEMKEAVIKECYMAIIKKDTIAMSLELNGNQVTGDLSYKYFEKDKSIGTLEGAMKGDSLIGNYTFMSEGIKSIRQVVFLRNGNTLAEGYGPIEEGNRSKIVFKDIKNLKFDGKIILSKVDCK